ncbi:MAG: hypothetical protein EXR24_00425 [Ignavibacteria bacterium]|nr:hypothetical protein [Ignavibacteria bacterium]
MREFLNLPLDASENGYKIDEMIALIHWIMFILAIGWSVFFYYSIYKFRKSKNPVANYTGVTSKTSTWLEVAMVVFETILLIAFAIPLWAERVVEFPAKEESTIVRIIGEQFAWNVHYPGVDGKFGRTDVSLITADNPIGIDRENEDAKDDVITNNQLNIPVNKPVIIYLGSKDVIHSLSFPVLRAKHDAMPGQLIPMWFKPVKTSLEVQNETIQTYDLTKLPATKNIILPKIEELTISAGGNLKNYILMENATKDGNDVLYSGMLLDADNVKALVDNSISKVKARKVNSVLQTLLTTEDYKDATGNILVPMGTPLIDDFVSMLLQNNISQVTARHKAKLDYFIFWEDYTSASISKGSAVTDLSLEQLKIAGIKNISIALATPIEIACAQLCGLGHYRMRGYVNIQTQEEYDIWMKEKEAELVASE